MNTDTHVFESSAFGESCFLAVALPVDVLKKTIKTFVDLTGSLHSINDLDVVEHVVFKHYAQQFTEPAWIAFPQGESVRILHMADGLPVGAVLVSNNAKFRDNEIIKAWQGLNEFPESIPTRVILLDMGNDYDWFLTFFANKNVTLEHSDVSHLLTNSLFV